VVIPREHPAELVFAGWRGARLDQKNLAARTLKPACIAAGLVEIVDDTPTSWISWHTFRHTCLTQVFRSGWNAAQVCRFAGHSDPGFALRAYVHRLDQDPTPACRKPPEVAVPRSGIPAVAGRSTEGLPPSRRGKTHRDTPEGGAMSTDEVKGRTKEAAGVLTDDDDLQREGRRDQAAGDAKEKLRDAENWAEDKIDHLKDRLDRDN
jgi:uncharacterized protein YjbJ (UPF0337 family)